MCPREDLGRKASGRGEAESALGDIGKNSVSRFTRSASGHREKASDLLSSQCVPCGEPCMASAGTSELLVAPETLKEEQICTEHV